jgi:hypothetical protein
VISPRVPTGPLGIPIATLVAPNQAGQPLIPIAMPLSLGFAGATTSFGQCIASGIFDAGGLRHGWVSDGDWQHVRRTWSTGLIQANFQLDHLGGASVSSAYFDLVDNVTHPANARAVRVLVASSTTFTAGTGTLYYSLEQVDTVAIPGEHPIAVIASWQVASLSTFPVHHEVDIPLHYTGGGAATRRFRLQVFSAAPDIEITAATLVVQAVKFSR